MFFTNIVKKLHPYDNVKLVLLIYLIAKTNLDYDL